MFKKTIFLIFLIIFMNNMGVFAAPSIVSLTDNRADYTGSQIPKYEKYEITFTLDSAYSNPYNFDTSTGGVKIDAYFTNPGSGLTDTVAAFWFQDYVRSTSGLNEVLTLTGSPCWKVRYASETTGAFNYSLKLNDSTGDYILSLPALTDTTFTVVDSSNKGFIRLNPRNNRYFAYENGNDFFGIGLDVAWWQIPAGHQTKTYAYDEYFSYMKQNKMNFARVWMVNSIWQYPDWVVTIQQGKNNIGSNYDLADAWRMDKILSSAKDNGIYIQLTLEDVNSFAYNWDANIYNTVNSGPLVYRSEFFTNTAAKNSWKQLLRYLVARYGYNTNILSWELWNEINELQWSLELAENWNTTWADIKTWHSEMAQDIKNMDVNKHMITTSTGSFKTFYDLYSLPEIEYAQIHGYYVKNYTANYSPSDMFKLITYYSKELYKTVPNKPNIFAEFGALGSSWTSAGGDCYDGIAPDDTTGIYLHNALWTGTMQGLATTPLSWAWPEHLTYLDWWQNYKILSNYLESEISSKKLCDTTLAFVNSTYGNLLSNPGFENGFTDWLKNPTTTIKYSIDTTISHSGAKSFKWSSSVNEPITFQQSVSLIPNLSYTVSGWVKKDTIAGPGVQVYVATSSNGITWTNFALSPYLKGTSDWAQFSFNFTAPAATSDNYQARVVFAFTGTSGTIWIDDVQLAPSGVYATPSSDNANLRILAGKNDTSALVWVQNKNHTWYNVVVLDTAINSETGSVNIPSMSNMNYSVEWWDTYSTTGTLFRKQKANASDGTLNIFLPVPLTKDIAAKIKPLTDSTFSVLDWTGEIGYTNDGVNPESGYSNTTVFTFRVKYTDPGNYFPAYMRLLLDKNGDGDYADSGEVINMDEADTNDNNVTDGKIYTKDVTIPFSPGFTNISYKFEAYDGIYLASGTPATAINSPDLILNLSLTISSAEINLNKLNLASFSQPASITVNNTANEGLEAFTLQITGAGADWVPGSVSAGNTYVLKALFTGENDIPVAGDFNDDDIVTSVNKTATSTIFGDPKFSANGASVPAGSAVKLWLLFKTPKSSNSQTEQNIALTIGIIDAN
ncbi:MAG: DUF5060 domain-containing protein [bacterium]|nr:DUF5060 domain-containing protein [bacterium]